MAPAFPTGATNLPVASRMFQRPLSAMSASVNDLGRSGDFFYRHEPAAMARRFADWQANAALGDLATIAAGWFRKSPKQMPASISVEGRSGETRTVAISGNALSGSW
jgi:hypothetical protein